VTQVTGDWLARFKEALGANDLKSALVAVESQATAHAGTAPVVQKRAAVKAILAATPAQQLPGAALWLTDQESDTAKEIGSMLLARSYDQHPDEAIAILRRLADDPNWEVREWAGSSVGEIFAGHFDELLPIMQDWSRDEAQFVRRAVCIAIRGAADRKRPERAEPLLALADTLGGDPSEEVKRNNGPFAVGGSLLACYPKQTLAHVRAWAASDDEMLRWNAAMVFVAANARKHIDEGLAILSGLASDKRRPVWMAVASAAKNLVKRDQARVEPELRRWLNDDRKLPASLALRHITIHEKPGPANRPR